MEALDTLCVSGWLSVNVRQDLFCLQGRRGVEFVAQRILEETSLEPN